MAVQSTIYPVADTRTYHSTKPIATKEHVAVWARRIPDGTIDPSDLWQQVGVRSFDIINNAVVFAEEFNLTIYSHIEVRVADNPNELGQSPSAIGIIIGIAQEIVIVAGMANEVVVVSQIEDEIRVVASDPLKQAIIDNATEPLRSAILTAENNANRAEQGADDSEASAEDSYKKSRVSEANAMTSDSFANQPVNTLVDYFYYDEATDSILSTPLQNTYSSHHWSVLSYAAAQGLKLQGVWNLSGITDPNVEPPAPVPLEDPNNPGNPLPYENGMYWYVVGDSIYDPDGDGNIDPYPTFGPSTGYYRTDDRIVYIDNPNVPYQPWLRLLDAVAWNRIVGIPQNVQNAVDSTGDTMTGELNANGGLTIDTPSGTSGDFYFDSDGSSMWRLVKTASDGLSLFRYPTGDPVWSVDYDTTDFRFFGNPSSELAPYAVNHLTRKDYVDGEVAGKVSKSGDTMTGALTSNTTDGEAFKIVQQQSGVYSAYVRFANLDGDMGFIGYGSQINPTLHVNNPLDGGLIELQVKDLDGVKITNPDDTLNKYTVWHKGNGGAGSGLDADKLDGLEGSDLSRYVQYDDWTGSMDDMIISGVYGIEFRSGSGDHPSDTGVGTLIVTNAGTSNQWINQQWVTLDGTYFRRRDSGVWGAWKQMGFMDFDGTTLNIEL